MQINPYKISQVKKNYAVCTPSTIGKNEEILIHSF